MIGERIFYKSKITFFSVPSNTTQINSIAFLDCPLREIVIPANSKLKKIGSNAFSCSNIESISMPSSISEFEENWCRDTHNLKNITIFQCEQQNIMYFDDKFIFQKSNPQSDIFDILIFARRDIQTALIPSFIKKISSCAFENCTSLKEIKFSENSELQECGYRAFYSSLIKSISIPPHLTKIGEECFYSCYHLETIKIAENSELKTICEDSFNRCKNLTNFEIPEKCELQKIGARAFYGTSIKEIILPANLTLIQSCSFRLCQNLTNFVITPRSSLLTIEKDIFGSDTPLRSISIPSSNIEFQSGWCNSLTKLNKITIIPNGRQDFIIYEEKYLLSKSNPDSDLYDVLEFAYRDIKTALIPSFIKIIKPLAFSYCKQLTEVKFDINSAIDLIDKCVFTASTIKIISIPPNVKIIDEYSFSFCEYLNKIEIPSSVTIINDKAFFSCNQLRKIDFPENSKIQKIESRLLWKSAIESLIIPQNVSSIDIDSFSCYNFISNIC